MLTKHVKKEQKNLETIKSRIYENATCAVNCSHNHRQRFVNIKHEIATIDAAQHYRILFCLCCYAMVASMDAYLMVAYYSSSQHSLQIFMMF